MSKFVREERYIVLKVNRLCDEDYFAVKGIYDHAMVEGVVVESDWPEYEKVWKMIEDRVNG